MNTIMKYSILLLTLLTVMSNSVQAQSADDVLGFWLTDDGMAKIEIYKKEGKYHGKIIWLKEPNNPDGTPKLDTENPKEELRKRPVLGLDLVKGFVFEDGVWEDGEIYDPNNGKTYDCRMKLKGNKLEVRGYIGLSMFGRTVVWTKVKS
jgi:uncharacterized protein (DUF2147 family)